MNARCDADLSPVFRFANEIEPEEVRWLWPGRIPLGKLTLLIGDPGVGKSLLAADLAARVSAGLPWPGQQGSRDQGIEGSRDQGNKGWRERGIGGLRDQGVGGAVGCGVVLVCPEDEAGSTLRPRLAAAGADLASVCIVEGVSSDSGAGRIFERPARGRGGPDRMDVDGDPRTLNGEPWRVPLMLPDHAAVLEEAVRAVNQPRLVILDPLHAVLSPGALAGAQDLGKALGVLAEIAQTHNVAIVAVGHLTKTRSSRMLYRVRGSLAFVAAARAVLLLSLAPDQADQRLLCPVKTVYGPPAWPLALRIVPGPRLEWQASAEAVAGCIWNLPSDLVELSADAHSALSEACDWLCDYLAGGARPARAILRDARAGGVSVATLRRAKRILGVRSLRGDGDSGWLWSHARCSNREGSQRGSAQS